MNVTLIILSSFVGGAIIGFIIYHFTLGKKQAGTQQQELDNTQAELDRYKTAVNNHFTSSAALMEQVTSSYQALYRHMEYQSQELLSENKEADVNLLSETVINKNSSVHNKKEDHND
ncbi:YhcB family protein [Psychromonas antarctica]|jgi:uncharacterized membrane-anchored protein YhcB (DUF1043 family)|uniref:YhcB family protein n=1 Tax=Psychromonas antarctica TaxID=67573 RepID=UPI001EE7DD83|nr:DUF1043 family protein [Psychromonas antarctica]MCG6202337.1 YhcB family protein [Psychromonas antarctica]